MPQQSPYQIDIPATDILSYVYPEGKAPYEKPIWIDAANPERSLSPKQALTWIKRLGLGLDHLNIGRNDVVMMFSTNHIFCPVAYLGVAGSGRVFSGCNPAYTVKEIAFQITNTGAKLILVDPSLLDNALKAAEQVGFPHDKIFLFLDEPCETQRGIRDWSSFLATEEAAESWQWHRMSADESKSNTAVLNYSSGTTGLPKGVKISHQNIIANVCQSLYMRELEQSYPSGQKPPERFLGFLPLYHAYGQLWSITAAAITQTPCYYMRVFNFEPFLSHIQRHRITHIQTAPPVLVMLAKRTETEKYDLSSLINILCGAAPLSKELQNEVSTKFNLKVVQTWGMTEVTCSCLHVPGGLDDRSGSVGQVDPGAEIKLIDDNGNEVTQPGQRGEIFVKGKNICLGYWKNESATKATFDSDGFLKTGDVAIFDEKGWFWIVDRAKEIFKVNGFQVAPAELEAVLLENDDVADAAVCALNRDHEDYPRAYVVLKEQAKEKVTEKDVVEWMASKVAKHKRLSGGVKFIEEVPKSPSAKSNESRYVNGLRGMRIRSRKSRLDCRDVK